MEVPSHLKTQLDALAKDLARDDDMGAVVRAHIRIENILIQIVEALLPEPSVVKRMNLDFDGYVNLALALGLAKELGPSLRAMGSLRNKFAHRLGTELDVPAVKNLYESLPPRDKKQIHASFTRIRDQHESVKAAAKNYSQLGPKDQFQLIAVVLWCSLQARLFKLQSAMSDE